MNYKHIRSYLIILVSMSMNKSKNTSTTKYTDVIIKNLTFTEMKETERSKGQKIAFPNYISASGESKMLYIQIP